MNKKRVIAFLLSLSTMVGVLEPCVAVSSIELAGTVDEITAAESYVNAEQWEEESIANDFFAEEAEETPDQNAVEQSSEPSVSLEPTEQVQSEKLGETVSTIAAPELEKAENEVDGIRLTWKPVADAAGYYVLRQNDQGEWDQVAEIVTAEAVTEYLDPEYREDSLCLVSGKTYCYAVQAYDAEGNISDPDAGVLEHIWLSAPKLKVSGTSPAVNLSWDAVEGAENYQVYRRAEDSEWELLKETADTTLNDALSEIGVKYFYTVQAIGEPETVSARRDGVAAAALETVAVQLKNVEKSVRISWGSVPCAESYRVYRQTSSGNWKHIATVTDQTRYEDTDGISSGKSYTYTVRACLGNIRSDYDSAGFQILYLPAPDLSISTDNKSATITWSAVKGVSGYYVYRKTPDTGWKKIATVKKDRTYTDTSLEAGVRYSYTVKGYQGSTSGGYDTKGVQAQALQTPTVNVSCSAGAVQVTWDEIAGAQTYQIYRQKSGEKWKRLTEVDASVLSWKDDLTEDPGTSYYYTVRAKSDLARSDYESSDAVKYLTNVEFTLSNTSKGIQVKWNAVSGSSQYRVYRKTEDGWKCLTKAKSNVLSYQDTDVQTGTSYTYTVRAVSGNSISGYDKAGQTYSYLAQPTLKSVVANDEGNKVKWEKVSGAKWYNVYRQNAGSGKWKKLAQTDDGSVITYQDNDVTRGKSYVYTVRAVTEDSISSYDARGLYCVFSEDIAYVYAAAVVNKITTSSMSNEKKLKACHNWFNDPYKYERDTQDPNKLSGTGWISDYAVYYFKNRAGNCYRFACAYGYLATVLGYQPKVVTGVLSGSMKHGWIEIVMDGTTYVFDAQWQFSNEARGKHYNLFKKTYKDYPFSLVAQNRYSVPK